MGRDLKVTDATAGSSPVLDAAFFRRWLAEATAAVERDADYLTELDSAIGDADHGSNLRRGFTVASAAVAKEPPATPGAVLHTVGQQLISSVGGASGPLYGMALRRAGKAMGANEQVTPAELRDALDAAAVGVAKLGGAQPGDKTMLDALIPAAAAFSGAIADGTSLVGALTAAATAAREGAAATIPLQARKGRASYLGERSIGHQDPGATSAALLIAALGTAASDQEPGSR